MGLDFVEAVLCWEDALDIEIDDADVWDLRTPSDAIAYLSARVGARDERGPCLRQRAFYRIRSILVDDWGVSRGDVQPEAELKELVGPNRKDWKQFGRASGLDSPSWPLMRPVAGLCRFTLRDAATAYVTGGARSLRDPGASWTRSQVRDLVRASIEEAVGWTMFSDDDDWAEIGFG